MDDWHTASEAADPPLPAYEEHGRLYHGSYRGTYLMPCDEVESDRLDQLHKIIRIARRKARIPGPYPIDPKKEDYRELHAAHFDGLFWASGQKPPSILDLGCGTGVWALEMAEKYPQVEVVGIDMVNIYPNRKTCERFPPNCYLQKGAINFENPWGMDADHWSFIRLGSLCGSVLDWMGLYRKILVHLKPGHGIIEQVEIDLRPRCDDGSLPEDPKHPLNSWYRLLTAVTAKAGRPIEYDLETPQRLESAGFVDVQDYTVQLPLHHHVNSRGEWPPTIDGGILARLYYGHLVGDRKKCGFHDYGSRDSAFESMSLAAFTRELRWTFEQWAEFQEQIIESISRPDLQVYHVLHIITGRKPNKYERSSRSP